MSVAPFEALCKIVGDLRNLVTNLISENAYEQKSFDKFRDVLLRLNNLQIVLDTQKEQTSPESENSEYNYNMTPVIFEDIFMAKRDFTSKNPFTESWDTGDVFQTGEYHIEEPSPSHKYISLKVNKPPQLIVRGSETDEFDDDFDDEFVNKYKYKVDWYNVCICKEISEKCMLENADSIHWKSVSIYQTLSPEFIDKYKDKLHIPSISYFQDLPDWLIEKYKDKWDWGLLSCKTFYNDTLRHKMRDEYIESVVRNRIIWDISENTWSEDVSE